ncbi:MAG: hypothetical protein LJE96_19410 [Deltaproteobacteria bacterium]|nr:hypothetical protein [Deltaproteobacteria bacterium]
MINVLLPLELDLGSSIAIRYAEILSDLIEMSLQSVHVVVPDSKGPEPGTGWVRKTWENALMNTDREEIQNFLELENAVRPRFFAPKILLGDRQEKLLNELRRGPYDLFMESALPTFDLSDFHSLVSSRLYRHMPCPAVLLVKNLVKPEKTALIIGDNVKWQSLIQSFFHILNKPVSELDVLYCRFGGAGRQAQREENDAEASLSEVGKIVTSSGWRLGACREITEGPEGIAKQLREYTLVASAVERNPKRRSPVVELLGRVLSPVLICWS